MNTHNQIIDNFLKHYTNIKSPTSYSYMLDYFLRNGLSKYKSALANLINSSKTPASRYILTFQSLYSHAIVDPQHHQSFSILLNLNDVLEKLPKESIKSIYEEVNFYLNEGKNLGETEQLLYKNFQNSSLFDIWNAHFKSEKRKSSRKTK